MRDGTAKVGGIWTTEQLYQTDRVGSNDTALFNVDGVGALDGKFFDRRDRAKYYATVIEKEDAMASHMLLGRKFIKFLRSEVGQALFSAAGFLAPSVEELSGTKLLPGVEEENCYVGQY